jgi:branched-chain amino acid transport system ATP-binding protein
VTGPLLRVHGLAAAYGAIEALHDVTLEVEAGAFVAVLGPNGAGKTTFLRALMGLTRARGEIVFDGQALDTWTTERRAAAGIALVPEGRGVLGPLTTGENLALGAYARRGRARAREVADDLRFVHELFPILAARRDQRAGALSGGEQQMLAIGRALMSRPRLLLLDEPSLGLAPRVAREIFVVLGELSRRGLTILVVEQKAPLALRMARRAHVLRTGRLVATVDPSRLESAADLAALYLGTA